MKDMQKLLITNMRKNGMGYKKISLALGISENTIKSFCKRNGLNSTSQVVPNEEVNSTDKCKLCGLELVHTLGKKRKRFCSDKCRNYWWNNHKDSVKRNADYNFVCLHCKKAFTAYGNSNRKYCCHSCYIADRFGGEQ